MKNKILKTFLFFVLFSTLLITASFAVEIKEDVTDYESDVYIIGSTRFDANQTITASMAANAGINEAKVQMVLGNDISNLKVTIYFYDAIFGDWYEINKSAKADLIEDTTTIKNIEENLNIFYEEGIEKTLEVPYEGTVDEGSIWSPNDNVTFENGVFKVPVLTRVFTFLSNNVANEVQTNVVESVLNGEDIVENVEIVPEWAAFEANGKYYSADSVDEMLSSANELNIKLVNNVDLKTAMVIDKKVTVDLNYYTVTAKTDTAGDGIFKVVTGGDLTINGEGTIDSACLTNDYSMAIWATGTGKVTINGGTFTNKGARDKEDDGDANNNELIYGSGNAQIIINDGTFIGNTENEEFGTRYTLNLKDQNNDTASIVVKGGTFIQYNPANSASENPRMNFLADGFKVVVYDDEYVVEPIEESDAILADGMSCEDLQTAVNNALKVKLLKDVELTEGLVITKKVTIDLNGKTLSANEYMESLALIKVDGGDLTIDGEGTVNSASQGNDYSMALWVKGNGVATINGGTFTNVGAKSVEDDGITPNNNELIYTNGGGKVTINGGRFIGNTENETYGTRYTLNKRDNESSEIIVKGGEFVEYDPSNSASENPIGNFVANGYIVNDSINDKNETIYTVELEVVSNN